METQSRHILKDILFAGTTRPPGECWRVDFEGFILEYYMCSSQKPMKVTTQMESDFVGLCFNIRQPFHIAGIPIAVMQANQFNLLYLPTASPEYIFTPGNTFVVTIRFNQPFQETLINTLPVFAKFMANTNGVPAQMTRKHLTICSDVLDILKTTLEENIHFPQKARQQYLEYKINEVVLESLEQLIQGFNPGSPVLNHHLRKIVEARDYLVSHLKDSFPLLDLVHITGLNKDKLEQGFKDLYGTTVHDFLVNERMKRASELLLSTTLPIQKIIESVGYKSLTTFTKVFRSKYGCAPASFRRNGHGRNGNGGNENGTA